MGRVLSLRTARKRRARATREAEAQENRVRHGRTAAQKAAERVEHDRASRSHDGHRLADDDRNV